MASRTRRRQQDPLPTFKERYQALNYLPPFFKEIWHTSPSLTLVNSLLRLLRSAIPFTMLYLGKLIIDEVVGLINHPHSDWQNLWWYVGAELGLAVLSDVLNREIQLLDALLGDLYANRSSLQIMEHAGKLDLAQFEDPTFYDKLERARQQTVGRTQLLAQTLAQVQDVITVVFLAAGLIVFNPWLLLILTISVVPAFWAELKFSAESYSLVHNWTPQRRELDYYRYLGASNVAAKEVKLFDLSGFLAERFGHLSKEYYQKNKQLAIRRAVWGGLLAALGTLGYYFAYGYMIYATLLGLITLGSLTFLAGSFRQMRSLLEGILNRFTSISQGALYLKDLFDFFKIEPSISSSKAIRQFPEKIQEGFIFENVGFKYPNSERWACRNLNFTLKTGEKLALVGENGAGKTTLVKLLTRLYDPDEGRILLDGHDLREYSVTELQKNIGVIFQDYIRLLFTARINIAVGDINSQNDTSKLEYAARQSLSDIVISRLPQGFDQMLGRTFQGGVELSGGEWQKIALARAYMREAQVLILDEPTAALDARAEFEVFERFTQLTEGKTALLISHRFSTVRMADRILVLEAGVPIEIGNHQELLEKNGKYAELFRLQAKGYV